MKNKGKRNSRFLRLKPENNFTVHFRRYPGGGFFGFLVISDRIVKGVTGTGSNKQQVRTNVFSKYVELSRSATDTPEPANA